MSDAPAHGPVHVTLEQVTAAELYVLLVREDAGLADALEPLRDELERVLYQRLSIAEMEEVISRATQRM